MIIPFFSFGQTENHHCGIDHVIEKMRENEPELWKSLVETQEELNAYTKQYSSMLNDKGIKKSGSVITIPVVFHVLHEDGPENISYEQILSAMDRLNSCFRKQNPELSSVQTPFIPLIADVEVEFKLAKRAPNGTCFNGVTRTKSAATNSYDEAEQLTAIINGNDVYNGEWPSNMYLNIFVCKVISSPGAAAYAYYPNTSTAMRFGVWSQHIYIGSVGTSSVGRSGTIVHELGHWFNLRHTWGNKNLVDGEPQPGDCDINNDLVQDTPFTIGNKTCAQGINTCDGDDSYWGGPMIDNVENFMEYSYCFKMFTIGQKERMRAALENPLVNRKDLYTVENLIATGVNEPNAICKVDFVADKYIVCQGESINFKDMSYFGQTSWSWTFEGATILSSIDQNPTVTYNQAGNYSVTLEISDGVTSDSKTKTAYITVLPNPGYNVAFIESFENISSFPSERWFVNDNSSVVISNDASVTGSKSLKIINNGSKKGNKYELISTTYDFSGDNFPYISFKYAYAKRDDSNFDELNIWVSNDCGENWVLRRSIWNLISAPQTNINYIPSSGDWVTETITNIGNSFAVSNFRVKFEFISDGGNNFYIEDINFFGDVSLDVKNIDFSNNINYYPNPTNNGDISLTISLVKPSLITLNIYDVLGKRVENIELGFFQKGNNVIPFTFNNLSTGSYIFETTLDGVPLKRDKIFIK
jgi:PKD repeat protein